MSKGTKMPGLQALRVRHPMGLGVKLAACSVCWFQAVGLVIWSVRFEAAVQDPDEMVAQLVEGCVVADMAFPDQGLRHDMR